MTAAQLEIMQHTLGLNYKSAPWRNYYCASLEDGKPPQDIQDLVEAGLMRAARPLNGGRDQYFCATDKGKAETIAATPQRKPNRDQLRYEFYLRCREVHDGLKFREFIDLYLKHGMPDQEMT